MVAARDVEDLNSAMHVLMLRLNIARLDLWSDKLSGMGYLDLHALAYAEMHPDNTLSEIRDLLQVPQSTLTSIIDRLEKRGLARRALHPQDKRSYRIELTAKGLEIQQEHRRVERLIMRKILDALPNAEDRARFVELFRTIASRV